MQNRICFFNDWNHKLNCKAFTTIRLHNPTKYVIGCSYEIFLNQKHIGDAILKSKRTLKHSQFNEFISYLDTGYSVDKLRIIFSSIYKDIDLNSAYFDFCLLVYINRK